MVAALLSVAPPARAEASVTVYGLLDTTLRHATNAGAGGRRLFSMNDGAFTGSRLGFRGTEELDGGMKAFFSLEQGLDPSAGTLMQATAAAHGGQSAAPAGRAFGREALVGLSAGRAGTLTLGRQYTLANAYSSRFQPNANPNQEVLALLVGHQGVRQDNMVKYTVEAGPLSAGISTTLGEGTNGSSWAVAGAVQADGLDVAAYASSMVNVETADTRRVMGLGAAFEVAHGWKAYLGTLRRRDRDSRHTNTVWVGGLTYTSGPFIYTVSAGEDCQRHVAAGARQLAWLQVDYLLSKRTDVYAVLDANRITGAYPLPAFMTRRGQQRGVQLGVRHRF